MRAAITLVGKDLRLRLRDRSALLFAFVIPLVLTFVFAQLFPDTEEFRMTAAVVDLDGGPVAAGFTEQAVPALVDAGVVELREVTGEAPAREALEDGTIDAAWVVPDGFSEQVTAGMGAGLIVLVNPDRPIAALVARAVAAEYAARLDRATLAVATALSALGPAADPAMLGDLAQRTAVADLPIGIDDLVAPDRRLDPVSYLAAGMAAFFLFFTVQFGVTGLLEERRLGTLPRLLAAPVGVGSVYAGKALGAFVIGLASMTVLAVASSLVLGAHWGHPAGVAILIVSGTLAALGVMALVASFAKTAEQAGNLQAIVALVLGLAGGVFFPVGDGLLGTLRLVSPHGWFLRGLGDLTGTGRVSAVLPAAVALLAFAVVAAAPAAFRMRRGTV